MSRVLTFSRVYPSYHPKAGQPTRFIEKIYASLADNVPGFKIPNDANALWDWHEYYNCVEPKHHTIRAGHRWKVGDWFSPRVWGNDINPKTGRSGPYHSKQIIIAPDIPVKKIWDFDIDGTDFYLNGRHEFALTGDGFDFMDLAENDGLHHIDLQDWFTMSPDFKKKGSHFDGQIICWNESIEY